MTWLLVAMVRLSLMMKPVPWRVPWACSTSMRTTLSRTSSRLEMPPECAICTALQTKIKAGARTAASRQRRVPKIDLNIPNPWSKISAQIAKLKGVQQARRAVSGGERRIWLTASSGTVRAAFGLRPWGPWDVFRLPQFWAYRAGCSWRRMHFFRRHEPRIGRPARSRDAGRRAHGADARACASHGAASLYSAARAGQGPERARGRRASSPIACRAAERDACPPVAPHDHRNDCPMCWSLAVVGSGVLPAAPAAVSLEAPRHQALIPLRVVDRVPVRAGANFQARAPPIV